MLQGNLQLYDAPAVYDLIVPPGPCESFYRGLASETGGPILELGCGTGRLTVPLALDGHEIVGLDSSAAMLRAAQAKAEAEDASIQLIQGDMRCFDLERRFGMVFVSCNSLAHLTGNDDLIACFRRIAAHLAPAGLFAFDVVNPRLADLTRVAGASVRLEVSGSRPRVVATEELVGYDPVQQIRLMQWRIEAEGGDGRTLGPVGLRTIFPQELPLLLEAAGLELTARYGDFDGNPLTGDSLNQVCVTRRADTRPPA